MITLKFDKCDISYFAFTLSLKRMRLLFFTLFSFTNRELDPVSNTYFAQARQYNPEQGRFLSEDLIRGFIHAPFTQNHYIYCFNQPLNLVDLDGLWPSLNNTSNTNSATSHPFGPTPTPVQTPTLRNPNRSGSNCNAFYCDSELEKNYNDYFEVSFGQIVNGAVCSTSVEVELGVGFQKGGTLGPMQGEIGVSNSDRLHYHFSDGFGYTRSVREAGAQVVHETSGYGLFAKGQYTDHEGGEFLFGPRRGNSELDTIEDRTYGLGISGYLLIGGGVNVEINLSEMIRRAKENTEGLWQPCNLD